MGRKDNVSTRVDVRIPNQLFEQIEAVAESRNAPINHRSGKPEISRTIVELLKVGITNLEQLPDIPDDTDTQLRQALEMSHRFDELALRVSQLEDTQDIPDIQRLWSAVEEISSRLDKLDNRLSDTNHQQPGDWGLVIGDWGLGTQLSVISQQLPVINLSSLSPLFPNPEYLMSNPQSPQSPIANAQSLVPNPQSPITPLLSDVPDTLSIAGSKEEELSDNLTAESDVFDSDTVESVKQPVEKPITNTSVADKQDTPDKTKSIPEVTSPQDIPQVISPKGKPTPEVTNQQDTPEVISPEAQTTIKVTDKQDTPDKAKTTPKVTNQQDTPDKAKTKGKPTPKVTNQQQTPEVSQPKGKPTTKVTDQQQTPNVTSSAKTTALAPDSKDIPDMKKSENAPSELPLKSTESNLQDESPLKSEKVCSTPSQPKRPIFLADLAKKLGRSPETVRRWGKSGKLTDYGWELVPSSRPATYRKI